MTQTEGLTTTNQTVNQYKLWILSKTISFDELQQQSSDAAQQIRRNFYFSSVRDSDEYCSWGQYANHSPNVDQSGIYGTSVAVQTLSQIGNNSLSSQISRGEQWLFNEWTSVDSRTSKKLDQAVVYKHVWCLNALGRSGTKKSNDYFDTVAENLWNKKVEWGWGEYNYDIDGLPSHEVAEPMVLSTALVLGALARSTKYSRMEQYEESLAQLLIKTKSRLQRYNSQGIGDKQKLLLESAFVLISCYEYDNYSESGIKQFRNNIRIVGRNMISLLNKSEGTTPNTSVFHQYMMPKPEEKRSRHISFLLNPIACLSVVYLNKMDVSLGGFELRWQFIFDNVIYYANNVYRSSGSDQGYYTRPHQGMVSNSDNYWIARFLWEFSTLRVDEVKLSRLVIEEIKSKLPVSLLFLLIFLTLAAVGGILTLNQELGIEVVAGILLAISSAVIAKFVEYILPRMQR